MERQRIKVLCWRCWPLLVVVVVQQFFQACLAASDPCDGIYFNDVDKVSYGNPTFITCQANPNFLAIQTETFLWTHNGIILEQDPNLSFDNSILDVSFIESEREGIYNCTYQQSLDPASRVNGISDPMCLIVRGVPSYVACPGLETDQRCDVSGEAVLFYTGEELHVPVDVEYVGTGNYGVVFEVVSVSISRPASSALMSCTTMLPSTPEDDVHVDFNCSSTNVAIKDRINGSVLTDRKSYMNASFVINAANVNDSGDYTVRVTALDTSTVLKTSLKTTTTLTRTTITMVLSASAMIHPPIPTSSMDIPGTIGTSTVVPQMTSTFRVVQTTPTMTESVDSPNPGNDAIIAGVAVVAGIIILILLLGIVSVCLFILHGMCPKLKKQIMDNVRLITMKTNGREDIITVITEGNTMQNAKHYSVPQFELPGDKNSKSADV